MLNFPKCLWGKHFQFCLRFVMLSRFLSKNVYPDILLGTSTTEEVVAFVVILKLPLIKLNCSSGAG